MGKHSFSKMKKSLPIPSISAQTVGFLIRYTPCGQFHFRQSYNYLKHSMIFPGCQPGFAGLCGLGRWLSAGEEGDSNFFSLVALQLLSGGVIGKKQTAPGDHLGPQQQKTSASCHKEYRQHPEYIGINSNHPKEQRRSRSQQNHRLPQGQKPCQASQSQGQQMSRLPSLQKGMSPTESRRQQS